MEIHILGPVGLGSREGRLGLGSDKERLLLAALALDVGRPVALDTLVDRLWDSGPPPAKARESVHTYVSRIRRALRSLAAPGADGPAVTHRAHTYTLRAEPEAVDWHRYLRLADHARAVSAEGDDVRAAALMRQAERLWEGEALAGLPGVWPERVRMSLAERRRGVAAARIAIELRLGRFAEAAAELAPLVDQYPRDETLVGQLMVAHYGSGRHADALLVHQALRRALRAGFGTDPGDELSRIHAHILRRAPVEELTGGVRAQAPGGAPPAGPSPAGPRPLRGHLPGRAPLIGRHEELRRIREAVDTAAEHGSAIMLESISGMAGVGKTALAVRAAHECADRFPDGQLYLDLRAHAQGQEPLTAGAALATLLRLLDVPPQSIPTDVEERAALWRRALARRRVLVVLDDAAEPAQVRPLLPGGTESFAIVTSRRRLVGLPQSRSLALDVLPAEDAVRLFREVAGLGPRGDGEERAEIERIVRLCGHLPLAIEIAANRLSAHPSWTPAVLRERLTRTTGRLGEIRDGYSEVARAFEMSYQTLSPDERTTFRLLSLHVGPEFGPRAAAALRGRPVAETERALESLFHCHLLQEPSPNRFRFHDLLGEYARLLCAATETPEQRDAALDRLIDHYLHEADRCDRTLYPRRLRLAVPAGTGTAPVRDLPDRPDRPDLPVLRDEEALAWFRTERSNLVDAARHERLRGRHEGAARLSHVLAEFLNSECHWVDALRLHDAAVDHWTGAGDTDALCRALLDLSRACAATGNYARAEDSARRSLRLAERTGCADVEAEALRELGVLHWHMGRNQQALVFHERSLALCARTEDPWRRARCENNIAISLLYLGRHDEALRAFRSAINGFRTAGDQRMLGKTLNNLGNLYMHMGRPAQARRTLESGLRIAELAGSRLDLVALQINLAETLATSGNPRKAIDVYRRALPVLQELGDRKTEAIALTGIGTAHRAMGRTDQAATHFQQALALSSSIGAVLEETRARRLLGAAEFARGNVVAAVEHITAAIASARHIEAPDEEAKAEESLAEVRMSAGDVAGARALWRHAHGLLQPLDAGAAERIQNRLIEVDHLPQ